MELKGVSKLVLYATMQGPRELLLLFTLGTLPLNTKNYQKIQNTQEWPQSTYVSEVSLWGWLYHITVLCYKYTTYSPKDCHVNKSHMSV